MQTSGKNFLGHSENTAPSEMLSSRDFRLMPENPLTCLVKELFRRRPEKLASSVVTRVPEISTRPSSDTTESSGSGNKSKDLQLETGKRRSPKTSKKRQNGKYEQKRQGGLVKRTSARSATSALTSDSLGLENPTNSASRSTSSMEEIERKLEGIYVEFEQKAASSSFVPPDFIVIPECDNWRCEL